MGFSSYSAMTGILAKPLEQEYQPLKDFEALKGVKWIVVLSGGGFS